MTEVCDGNRKACSAASFLSLSAGHYQTHSDPACLNNNRPGLVSSFLDSVLRRTHASVNDGPQATLSQFYTRPWSSCTCTSNIRQDHTTSTSKRRGTSRGVSQEGCKWKVRLGKCEGSGHAFGCSICADGLPHSSRSSSR